MAFQVSLQKIADEFSLEILNGQDLDKIKVEIADLNRPGLQLSGFFEYFDKNRIQVLGKNESSYLTSFDEETQEKKIDVFFSKQPVAVVVARNLHISDMMIEKAKKYDIPLFRTQDTTSSFTSALNAFLNVHLAPRITRHGVLVEVYGEGVLLLGESGVGKSEAAIELIKRGHRLIADDAVEIRKVSNKTLVGSSPENIRHYIELRGIGIINVRRIFGMGAIKATEKIDMIINLEPWKNQGTYDRMGLDTETTEILGIDVTSTTIPIKPGRNLAVIIEVAAMNNRHKKMGYNAAKELLAKLSANPDDTTSQSEWENF